MKGEQKFRFGEEQQRSFEQLKEITTEPILQIHYQSDAITNLHTDAKEGYGAVLLQKRKEEDLFKPVYYMSRKTIDAEKKYHSIRARDSSYYDSYQEVQDLSVGHQIQDRHRLFCVPEDPK